MKRTTRSRNVGICLPRESKSKKVSRGGRRRKATRNTGSSGQLKSKAREYLEQVKCCSDTDCTHRMMKQGFLALRSGEWEEKQFQEGIESLGMGPVTEYRKLSRRWQRDEAKKAEHRPRNHDKMHRLLATHHRASGKLRCHICARIVTVSRWKTTFGASLGEKDVTIGGARFVEKSTTGSNPKQALGGANR